MKLFSFILFFTASFVAYAQTPKLVLQPGGFDAVSVTIPSTANEKLIELSKNWATQYKRRKQGIDVSNVSANSMLITGFKKNAFFYSNKGETFYHKIKYDMHLTFNNNSYTVQFNVSDIYIDDDVLLEYKLPDYFTSEGNLKDGYNTLKTSLEDTVNDMITSHYNFIVDYR